MNFGVFFFFWCWDQTQGLVHASQALCHRATSQPLSMNFVSLILHLKMSQRSWPPEAHACSISYLGGRDQEDHSLNTGQIVFKNSNTHHTQSLKKMGWQSDLSGREPTQQV
jgi:hypothetical protein